MEEKLVKILNEMAEYLNISQMKKLQEILLKNLQEPEEIISETTNYDYLKMFIAAKRIEGCSERTVAYYKSTVEHMLRNIDTPIRKITTDEIRCYLAKYQENGRCSKTTVDNIRRNISSFFSWLEEEDYILKSPMKRIHKIKTMQPVKETISDELIERLRDACICKRDLAIVDLLYSTGIRVGELVRLNVDDPIKEKVHFCYYRLAKGISGILSYAKEGVRLWFRTKRPAYRQLCLKLTA